MTKFKTKHKALCAFKKLGAAMLIIATLTMCFTACKQTSGGGGGGKQTPKPKHKVTFSVEGGNGTLKAKVEDIVETETSPINVEEEKTVTFIATANDGYKVKGWTLDDSPVAEAGTKTEYKHKVTAAATVKVSFESNSTPPTPQTKYTVTLTQAEGGKVTASPEIPEDKQVAKDTEITFTAQAGAGYKIGTWLVSPVAAIQSGGDKGNETATVKITADMTISVNFELIPETAILTLDPDKLNIKIRAVTADDSDIQVGGCTETMFGSGNFADLHANGTTITLKGKIIDLYFASSEFATLNVQGLTTLQKLNCGGCKLTTLNVQGLTALKDLDCSRNQLTELDVQGCVSLQMLNCDYNKLHTLKVQGLPDLKKLYCVSNQLNAEAMTELLNALPARKVGDGAVAGLYTKYMNSTEGNCKDYTKPSELKKAFDGAKSRNWKLQRQKPRAGWEDI